MTSANFDPNDPRFRAVRSLRRASIATRAIGILVIVGAVCFLLVALDMRSTDDRVGFSLLAMAVMLLGVLVWGTGTFHRAAADALPMLGAIVDKLDRLGAPPSARHDVPNPVAAPAPAAPNPIAAPAPVVAPPADPSAPMLQAEPNADSTDGAPEGAPTGATSAGLHAPQAEPENTPCPHCGGLIHPEASRCVHCMKKVAKSR